MPQPQGAQAGPPYVPNVAGVGGRPTVLHDAPVLAVLLLFYVVGAATNMTIFQINRRKGHKFIMSVALFGFCMSRILTCILRLVWATRPTDAGVAIAAQIFTNVGILVIYIIVLLLSMRVFRATHPKLGWNPVLRKTIRAMYFLLLVAIVLVISFTILSFYTLDMKLRNDARWIQRAAIMYMMLFNVISLVLFLLSVCLPRAANHENFGQSSMGSKMAILGFALFFTLFIAGFRTGTAWAPTRPASDPAWFDTKAAFYVIEFAFEIITTYALMISRFDQKFWVPDGSTKPGDYSETNYSESKQVRRTSDTSV